MSDYKWVTESPEFAFTDDERWEVTDTGEGFALRQNLNASDPGGTDADWELVDEEFATMAAAMAYADERQNALYGIPSEEGRKTYEAWLRRQPAGDLREMLRDRTIDAGSAAFIRRLISDRRSPAYDN